MENNYNTYHNSNNKNNINNFHDDNKFPQKNSVQNNYYNDSENEDEGSIILSSHEIYPEQDTENIESKALYKLIEKIDRKSTRLNSSHLRLSRMPSSA